MRILVVGMGGLGCPATLALIRAGFTAFTLVDPDRVEVTNLHRQLLYQDRDLGRLKVEAAAQALRRAHPNLQLRTVAERLNEENGAALVEGHALVVDAVDGTAAKFLLSDLAVRLRVPLIHAGAVKLEGQLLPVLPGGPCLRCLFEDEPSAEALPTCAGAGVLGSLVGVVGAAQGALAASVLRGTTTSDGESSLLRFDAGTLQSRTVRVRRRSDCVHP
ncbi:MAG: HesA/MoeB/ThiF family protein [Myxococcaceae bacterium]